MEPTDFDLITQAMHSTDIDAFVSPDGGSVVMSFSDSFGDDEEEPDDDWHQVPRAEAAEEYDDMVAFAAGVGDSDAQERLRAAMTGAGAFRRFKHAVRVDPTEVGAEWGAFQGARRELRALEWLLDLHIVDDEAHATLAAPRFTVLREIEARLARIHDRELEEIQELERELQSPECRRDRRRLEHLLAPDFVEIGVLGHRENRTQTIETLLTEDPDPILVQDLDGRRIAADVALIQWTSERAGHRALRTSLWRRSPDGWQLMHHQGTPLS